MGAPQELVRSGAAHRGVNGIRDLQAGGATMDSNTWPSAPRQTGIPIGSPELSAEIRATDSPDLGRSATTESREATPETTDGTWELTPGGTTSVPDNAQPRHQELFFVFVLSEYSESKQTWNAMTKISKMTAPQRTETFWCAILLATQNSRVLMASTKTTTCICHRKHLKLSGMAHYPQRQKNRGCRHLDLSPQNNENIWCGALLTTAIRRGYLDM